MLLLDEPTSHLDVQHQVETFRLMLDLCRERRLAVVAVVHDLTLAAMFADRIALMSQGVHRGERRASRRVAATTRWRRCTASPCAYWRTR